MQTLTVNGFQNSRIYQRWFVELHTYYLQISGSDQFLFYRPVIDFKVAKPNEHTHAHTHTLPRGVHFIHPMVERYNWSMTAEKKSKTESIAERNMNHIWFLQQRLLPKHNSGSVLCAPCSFEKFYPTCWYQKVQQITFGWNMRKNRR